MTDKRESGNLVKEPPQEPGIGKIIDAVPLRTLSPIDTLIQILGTQQPDRTPPAEAPKEKEVGKP